jgi:hypothetical protein
MHCKQVKMEDTNLDYGYAAPPQYRIAKRPGAENWVAESEKGESEQDPNEEGKSTTRGASRERR